MEQPFKLYSTIARDRDPQTARHSIDMIVRAVPSRTEAAHLKDIEGTLQLHITGGDPLDYYVIVSESKAVVHAGLCPTPQAVVTVPAPVFLDICEGEIRIFEALNHELLNFNGDPELMLALSRSFLLPPELEIRRYREQEEMYRDEPPIRSLDSNSFPSRSFLRKAGERRRAFVMPGVITGWKACSWTLDYLETTFGSAKLAAQGAVQPLGSFINKLRQAAADGAKFSTVSTVMPEELAGDLGAVPFFPKETINPKVEMFFSATGSVTRLHRDNTDGIVTPFMGKRRIYLFAPNQTAFLYPFQLMERGYQECHVDPTTPDYEKYPLFNQATGIDIILEPGDLLYIPLGWFHHVVTLETSIAAKFNFRHGWPSFVLSD